jgi:hypothetical protein
MTVWLAILCLILTVWNPAGLALLAASTLANSTFSSASWLSLVFLAIRLLVTSIGVAAGIALWRRRPGAVWLAKLSLVLFAVEAAVRLSTRVGLSEAPPGTRLPRAILLIVHNAAWFFYLEKSRRVRKAYGLESQP